MNDPSTEHPVPRESQISAAGLLRLATAQRSLAGSLLLVVAAFVVMIVIAVTHQGKPATIMEQLPVAVAGLIMAACVFEHARAGGRSRGMRWTLALAVLVVPCGALIIPGVMLVLGRGTLRRHGVDAGLFWVRADEVRRLRTLPEAICPVCSYDREGLAPGAVCPECGNPAPPVTR